MRMGARDFEVDRSEGKLLGVHYVGDGEGTVWLDPELKAMQEDIDKRLPNLANIVSLPADGYGVVKNSVVNLMDTMPNSFGWPTPGPARPEQFFKA